MHSSISYVPNVKSHFWGIATMKRRAWRTVRLTTTSCLETCASFVTKSLLEMVIEMLNLFISVNEVRILLTVNNIVLISIIF